MSPFLRVLSEQGAVPYLEKAEIDALLATPDRRHPQGQRDYALLLFLYNSVISLHRNGPV